MNYLHWNEKTITDFSDRYVTDMYSHGYVFTRIGHGVMHQTRSCRIDLSKFELSSENRRILKKTEGLEISSQSLPLSSYDYSIGKLAKDFYDIKFGAGTLSAQKVKEMLTDGRKSNFNVLLNYSIYIVKEGAPSFVPMGTLGHAISYLNRSLLHYSYPFYDLDNSPKDMGLGMMIRAVQQAKEGGLKYAYLGSLQRPTDTYKFQFSGLEWFDGTKWQTDTDALKEILK